MAIRSARSEDIGAIRELLTGTGLLAADVSEAVPITFFVFEDDGHAVTACIGLEEYGAVGLLRSLAVSWDARNAGIGRALVATVEEAAARRRLERLYLLTTTASDFFARYGYRAVERGSAPDAIRGTTQFAELCPASATLMGKML